MKKSKLFKKKAIVGIVNDRQHMAYLNYSKIDPEKDMQNCVINLKLNHPIDRMVTKKMIEIEKKLLKTLFQNDICPNNGQKFQIRVHKDHINKTLKILLEMLNIPDYSYQIFIGNYVMNETDPVGQCMDDGLIEAGIYADYYWKKIPHSFVIAYDRKSKLMIFHKLKSI